MAARTLKSEKDRLITLFIYRVYELLGRDSQSMYSSLEHSLERRRLEIFSSSSTLQGNVGVGNG